MRVYSGPLHVHYGPAYVMSGEDGDTSDMEACFRGQSNGLLGAARRGWVFMLTGLHTGVVQLTVEVTDAQPLLGDEWEECVEASFAPHGPDVALQPPDHVISASARGDVAGDAEIGAWRGPGERNRRAQTTTSVRS
jgi:hypothetical protein